MASLLPLTLPQQPATVLTFLNLLALLRAYARRRTAVLLHPGSRGQAQCQVRLHAVRGVAQSGARAQQGRRCRGCLLGRHRNALRQRSARRWGDRLLLGSPQGILVTAVPKRGQQPDGQI